MRCGANTANGSRGHGICIAACKGDRCAPSVGRENADVWFIFAIILSPGCSRSAPTLNPAGHRSWRLPKVQLEQESALRIRGVQRKTRVSPSCLTLLGSIHTLMRVLDARDRPFRASSTVEVLYARPASASRAAQHACVVQEWYRICAHERPELGCDESQRANPLFECMELLASHTTTSRHVVLAVARPRAAADGHSSGSSRCLRRRSFASAAPGLPSGRLGVVEMVCRCP